MQSKYGIAPRLKSFSRFCKEKNLDLLMDDYRFIDRTLNYFSQSEFKAILDRYSDEWYMGMVEAENASQQQNMGRKRANLWLLGHFETLKARESQKEGQTMS